MQNYSEMAKAQFPQIASPHKQAVFFSSQNHQNPKK